MMIAGREDLQFHDPDAALAEAERRKRERELTETMVQAARESAPGKRQWFALEVRKNTEASVAEALEVEKICAWLPLKTIECKGYKTRRPFKKEVPICPGYLFVNIVPSAHAFCAFPMFKSAIGLVGIDDRPTPMAEKKFKAFKTMVERNVFDDVPRDALGNKIAVGDLVALHTDASDFITAVVDGYRKNRHVRLRMELFGGTATTTCRLDEIEKIG